MAMLNTSLLIHHTHGARPFLAYHSKCDAVDNNMCESFNGDLLEARKMHILSLLEWVRKDAMNRIYRKRMECVKWFTHVSPSSITLLEKNLNRACKCHVEYNGEDAYEVSEGENRHTVHMSSRSCTCRAWNLTGIPCPYAICALNHKDKDLLTGIHPCYSKETYLASYSFVMQPLKGKQMWPRTGREPLIPPQVLKSAGRPKIARRRDREEPKPSGKLSKAGFVMSCSYCHSKGHNVRGCSKKKKGIHVPPMEKGKTMVVDDEEQEPTSVNQVPIHTGSGIHIGTHVPQQERQAPPMANKNIGKGKGKKHPTNNVGAGLCRDNVIREVSFNSGELGDRMATSHNPIPEEVQRKIQHKASTAQFEGRPFYGRFRATGPQWNGNESVSTNQLETEVQRRISQMQQRRQNTESAPNPDFTTFSRQLAPTFCSVGPQAFTRTVSGQSLSQTDSNSVNAPNPFNNLQQSTSVGSQLSQDSQSTMEGGQSEVHRMQRRMTNMGPQQPPQKQKPKKRVNTPFKQPTPKPNWKP
ncbi:uncharacterized protein LOC126686344 [Mercurialis annua]|uniref:uncharacterized protein LOC126686344 n=1 Tax=Mercurialis annua TaxID=3986 RepID=UPI00215E30A7|nr:uncharacterized protein LOC126686344 [Mercurialis annua]